VQTQLNVNEEFLSRVGQDPTLAERLAQRQMKVIRQGSRVLDLQTRDTPMSATGSPAGVSPFMLVGVSPPQLPAAYQSPTVHRLDLPQH